MRCSLGLVENGFRSGRNPVKYEASRWLTISAPIQGFWNTPPGIRITCAVIIRTHRGLIHMKTAPLKPWETLRTVPETVRVGAVELHELKARWSTFRCMSDRDNKNFDPVASLRYTGAVIDAVESVMATVEASSGE